MADILLDFPVKAPAARVFEAMSTPAGLDEWWTLGSSGKPERGAEYDLDFGPGYAWKAMVTRCEPGKAFELEMTRADADWKGTRVGCVLEEREGTTRVRFHHAGWREANDHHRTSCFCWAMYLRVLRRHVEHGERVPYDRRLDA